MEVRRIAELYTGHNFLLTGKILPQKKIQYSMKFDRPLSKWDESMEVFVVKHVNKFELLVHFLISNYENVCLCFTA